MKVKKTQVEQNYIAPTVRTNAFSTSSTTPAFKLNESGKKKKKIMAFDFDRMVMT